MGHLSRAQTGATSPNFDRDTPRPPKMATWPQNSCRDQPDRARAHGVGVGSSLALQARSRHVPSSHSLRRARTGQIYHLILAQRPKLPKKAARIEIARDRADETHLLT